MHYQQMGVKTTSKYVIFLAHACSLQADEALERQIQTRRRALAALSLFMCFSEKNKRAKTRECPSPPHPQRVPTLNRPPTHAHTKDKTLGPPGDGCSSGGKRF